MGRICNVVFHRQRSIYCFTQSERLISGEFICLICPAHSLTQQSRVQNMGEDAASTETDEIIGNSYSAELSNQRNPVLTSKIIPPPQPTVKDERPEVLMNKAAVFQFGTSRITHLFNSATAYAVDVNQLSQESS
ncbi:MAG: hypothetical protein EZS28_011588 [Streblomastix strix]|uniref:Uncharacterized protein n=1 Tax=Streblomastix strix TaxID=222440 RepID=A0A5J4WER7_9EUKA|nr:MAG: hypothetical protein EZS28_011588 [Streblomastix strix]